MSYLLFTFTDCVVVIEPSANVNDIRQTIRLLSFKETVIWLILLYWTLNWLVAQPSYNWRLLINWQLNGNWQHNEQWTDCSVDD